MNEVSSKFVDDIATQKLIDEKLSRVRHFPVQQEDSDWCNGSFVDFEQLSRNSFEITEQEEDDSRTICFRSPVETPYEETNKVICKCFPAKGEAKGGILLVHGLFEDNLSIYNITISVLRKSGLDVHFLVLPYHYERKPEESLFSGELFWSADLHRNMFAFKQAVYDLHQAYNFVKRQFNYPVMLTGFSMGAGVVLGLCALSSDPTGVFLINPICSLSELVWERPLCSTIRKELEENGLDLQIIKQEYSIWESIFFRSQIPGDRFVLAKGIYDQINDARDYDTLSERLGIREVLAYKAGHLNILRVPRLSADIISTFETMTQKIGG